ncbi:hypothetical protein SDC9_135991 [bioreactor metagenome]|uniref:Uncharacterized protein n=1 Tax=bioreactor metagenome TaxID=1076179 RepID=A0A645DHZ7_9ZZZZ
MIEQAIEDLHVAAFDPMPTPREVLDRIPMTEAAATTVVQGRETLKAILDGKGDMVQFERFGFVRVESRGPEGVLCIFAHR